MREEKVTFCRICEPFCGMIATIENDKLVGLRPDRDHPLSKGFACPKGMAYPNVQNDPDRVRYPQRRRPDGGFERVSWDEAMTDIAARLRHLRTEYGGHTIASYMGNPAALNYSGALWGQVALKAFGVTKFYSAGSQDTNSRLVANYLLFGNLLLQPLPDLDHTELLVILGANPVVSHLSLASVPRVSDKLHAITGRGGRVLVIDPRRTETAREFEWLPIVPDADAWLLLSLVHVLFEEELVPHRVREMATGVDAMRALAAPHTPEATHAHTGIDPEQVRSLARQLVARKSVIYGRLGACLGSSATLVNFLIDTVNLLAGNLDVRGGVVFGQSPLRLIELAARAGMGSDYQPGDPDTGRLPVVMGMYPAAPMASEMTVDGPDRVRALIVQGGNPVLSTPAAADLETAMQGLDLVVSLDLYVNETNQYADYILPCTAMYEREDHALFAGAHYLQPFLQVTDAVVPAPGECREEWVILQELMERVGVGPAPHWLVAVTSRVGRLLRIQPTPRRILDALIRMGTVGDRFGLRPGGLTLAELLRRHPHGLVVAEQVEVGRLREIVRHKDHRVALDHAEIRAEVARLAAREPAADFPLRLIGQREPRSENSWMHNVATLRAARDPHAARMHPADVVELGLTHRGLVRLVSKAGAIELPVLATEDISRGVVAVPHGWGHGGRGSWRRANAEGGVNVNELASTDPADLDPLAGMSHLTGIPVRAERVGA
ncbi:MULTISPECIES: molybdopterin-containing oxidoreductase family protein [unclassified Nocardia]|uniref:molybdopterin-containing oxidoreductase family protein n=1 Tax=unclassified Nocardia TaxID=2637762 RepID=UPI0033BA408F